jgi:5-methylcytosine-specific restriction enzyme subunit McrC
VRLVERRARVVKLPAADARFLAEHLSHVIEVVPGFDRGTYRLTPRGYVGFADGPTRRFAIWPKLPWSAVRFLLGLVDTPFPAGETVDPGTELMGVFAQELAARMTTVAKAGLVRGYRDEDTDSTFLRGRLRTAEQLRDAARGHRPDLFRITDTTFDLDTPWNCIPKAAVSSLLARRHLPATVRDELAAALVPFELVPDRPVCESDYEAAVREPRAAAYNGLVSLCRIVSDGLTAAGARLEEGAFLIDLGRTFERYLTESVIAAFAGRTDWSVEVQPRFTLGESAVLQPDLLITRRGVLRAVLDAKWKTPGPDPADLHQILAYAAVTGANHVGLVYPGRRFARRELRAAGGKLLVSLYRLPLVGIVEESANAVRMLARLAVGRPRV